MTRPTTDFSQPAFCILSIKDGKAASEPYPRVGKLPYDDVIIQNT
ncbi:hypothetical protein J532_4472, partial [Acinetobacter baumannii 940793]